MRAMLLTQTESLQTCRKPLKLVDLPAPVPQANQVLIRISCCGVCHTELDEIEGRTPPPKFPVVPGHQIVGQVVEVGSEVEQYRGGERVGVGWIYSSDGSPQENLSPEFRATGRDVPGGYAEYVAVPERYAYPIPERFTDEQAAPLLCAGAIGYRAWKLTGIQDGQLLGLTGFGASAHLVLQLVRHLCPDSPVFVFARDAAQREFASQLGAAWVGNLSESPPERLHAIIDTTPAWSPVLASLERLRPGGRLVINAIRKETTDQTSLLQLDYARHLWLEKEIKSVANITRHDIAEFLPIAAKIPLQPEVETHPLEHANEALQRLQSGGNRGALVLQVAVST